MAPDGQRGKESGQAPSAPSLEEALPLHLTSLHSLLPALATALSTTLGAGGPAGGIWLGCNSFPAVRGGPSCSVVDVFAVSRLGMPQGRGERYFL